MIASTRIMRCLSFCFELLRYSLPCFVRYEAFRPSFSKGLQTTDYRHYQHGLAPTRLALGIIIIWPVSARKGQRRRNNSEKSKRRSRRSRSASKGKDETQP